MFVVIISCGVVGFFAWSLCKSAGDADDLFRRDD